jgi:hypothetical protein
MSRVISTVLPRSASALSPLFDQNQAAESAAQLGCSSRVVLPTKFWQSAAPAEAYMPLPVMWIRPRPRYFQPSWPASFPLPILFAYTRDAMRVGLRW